MKTKFENIEVAIDETTYVVSYSLASATQKAKLEEISKNETEITENYLKLNSELKILEAKKDNNVALIPFLEDTEKVEVLKEQRGVIAKIEKTTKEIEKVGKYTFDETIAEQRYEILVGGVDKDRLKTDAKANNIPLSVVLNEITAGVIKAKEKK